MEIEQKKQNAIFRIDIKDISTRKVRGFNVYENGKKIPLDKFRDALKEKTKEI